MKLTVKGYEVELNGNRMSGNTYPIKNYIKEYLCGKWDAENKFWVVDPKQVERMMEGKYPAIKKVVEANTINNTSKVNTNNNAPCPRCGTYCYGDCQAHK